MACSPRLSYGPDSARVLVYPRLSLSDSSVIDLHVRADRRGRAGEPTAANGGNKENKASSQSLKSVSATRAQLALKVKVLGRGHAYVKKKNSMLIISSPRGSRGSWEETKSCVDGF